MFELFIWIPKISVQSPLVLKSLSFLVLQDSQNILSISLPSPEISHCLRFFDGKYI